MKKYKVHCLCTDENTCMYNNVVKMEIFPEGHIPFRYSKLKFIGRPGLERAPRRQVMADLKRVLYGVSSMHISANK